MDKILVLDFGGQYDQLIARRVREQNIYAQIIPYGKITTEEIISEGFAGIIFTGGPASVYDETSPKFSADILEANIPILGICYGAQLIAYLAGGEVSYAEGIAEYGRTFVEVSESALFKGVAKNSVCWMSHRDYVSSLPEGYVTTAVTKNCPCAAFECPEKKIYAVQFHPEVTHTEYGTEILRNFLYDVCGCRGDWIVGEYAEELIKKYRDELKGQKVLLALSGGVDSSVAAALLHKAIGEDLTCVFVDHGLLRKGESELVVDTFKTKMGMDLIRVDAADRFLAKLKGVLDPEQKRKIIGEEFIRVFETEAKKIGHVNYLAQGTIYPDVIESGKGDSAVIKSHHNVGGLPDVISFDGIVEPLKDLFKDEVRKTGEALGLPKELVWRQPFPGPGLGVRICGEITEEKISLLREADAIFREELEKGGLEKLPDQYFAVLTDTRSVGVMGDARTFGYTAALRAVCTDDFMTASWTKIPYGVLEICSERIMNEVHGISRVVYDISSKPPSTVEWL